MTYIDYTAIGPFYLRYFVDTHRTSSWILLLRGESIVMFEDFLLLFWRFLRNGI